MHVEPFHALKSAIGNLRHRLRRLALCALGDLILTNIFFSGHNKRNAPQFLRGKKLVKQNTAKLIMKRFAVYNAAMPVPTKLVKTEYIAMMMTQNAAQYPNPPVTMVVYAQHRQAVVDAQSAMESGEKGATADRDAAALVLDNASRALKGHVNGVANGDVTKLLRSGFDLNKERTAAGPPPQAVITYARPGLAPGTVDLICEKVTRSRNFDVRVAVVDAQGNIGAYVSWGSYPTRKIPLVGLDSVTRYAIIVQVFTQKGHGPFSNPAFVVVG